MPDVLLCVELGRGGRQRCERQVGWDFEFAGGVPTGLIENDDGMGAEGDCAGDLLEMQLHGLAVGARQNECCASIAGGANGAEDIGNARSAGP